MDEEDNEFMVTIKVEETMVLRVVVNILLKSLRMKKTTRTTNTCYNQLESCQA